MGVPVRPGVIRSLDVQADTAAVVVVPAEKLQSGQLSRTLAQGVHRAAQDPLADVKLHAQQVRSEAEADAAAIRARAEADAQQLRQAAREEGYRAGVAQARTELEAELSGQLRAVTGLATELETLRTRLREEFEVAGLDLALVLAQRILHAEITDDPARWTAMLATLLEQLQPLQSLTLRVHPDELPLLESAHDRLSLEVTGGQLQLVADRSLPMGSLKASFEGGDLDASLEAQLLRMRLELLRSLLPGTIGRMGTTRG